MPGKPHSPPERLQRILGSHILLWRLLRSHVLLWRCLGSGVLLPRLLRSRLSSQHSGKAGSFPVSSGVLQRTYTLMSGHMLAGSRGHTCGGQFHEGGAPVESVWEVIL